MADTEKFVLVADAGDIARAAELRRIKALATLVLGGCVAVLIAAKMMERVHPAFGFVAAFAEAATIGGLADWYAVVALFRRPLGLPIPHTAIIQQNQHRIADKLGEFIEVHFLSPLPVDAKLREVDFARFISGWLTDRKKSADLARFVLRLLPEALNAAETSGLKSYLTRRIVTQLQGVDLAPLAAGTLRGFIAEGRHKGMLDDLLLALHETLNKPETLALLRQAPGAIIVATKCDRPDRKVTPEQAQSLAQDLGFHLFETSAKSNINIQETFLYLAREVRDHSPELLETGLKLKRAGKSMICC